MNMMVKIGLTSTLSNEVHILWEKMCIRDRQGAVDELGIGIIRDAFANYFFPGTSTIQTRAKYFLIVPYVLRDVYKRQLQKCMNDPEKAKYLEENLAAIPDCTKDTINVCVGTVTNQSYMIDANGNIRETEMCIRDSSKTDSSLTSSKIDKEV